MLSTNLRKKRLNDFRLYAVTDIAEYDTAYLKRIESALKGGVDIVQLRSKTLSDKELYMLGKKIRELTYTYSALFFVNDRPDLCCALDADGVHIGQDDLPVSAVRPIVGVRRLIGKSTHSVEQAKKTLKEDVNYIGFGPIYGTPTKPDYVPIGLKHISAVMRYAVKPVVCIGGISHDTVEEVCDVGARRIAVVRALFSSENVRDAAASLKQTVTRYAL